MNRIIINGEDSTKHSTRVIASVFFMSLFILLSSLSLQLNAKGIQSSGEAIEKAYEIVGTKKLNSKTAALSKSASIQTLTTSDVQFLEDDLIGKECWIVDVQDSLRNYNIDKHVLVTFKVIMLKETGTLIEIQTESLDTDFPPFYEWTNDDYKQENITIKNAHVELDSNIISLSEALYLTRKSSVYCKKVTAKLRYAVAERYGKDPIPIWDIRFYGMTDPIQSYALSRNKNWRETILDIRTTTSNKFLVHAKEGKLMFSTNLRLPKHIMDEAYEKKNK